MYTIVLALHVFVCILLIVAVLLQSGKGGDLGSALGGGSGSEIFGPGAPANIMTKVTTVIAACFLILSLGLALLASNRNSGSILQNYQQSAPAQQQQQMPPANMPPAE
jgi:preprotein translocase subunit SecG